MDLWKLIFVILLVLLMVAGAWWVAGEVLPVVTDRGTEAASAFASSSGPAAVWGLVASVFDARFNGAFAVAFKIALAGFGILFGFQLIKWVNGA